MKQAEVMIVREHIRALLPTIGGWCYFQANFFCANGRDTLEIQRLHGSLSQVGRLLVLKAAIESHNVCSYLSHRFIVSSTINMHVL